MPNQEAFFLQGPKGRLFALYHPCAGETRHAVLAILPFAEEMNRCRALVAQQARAWAEHGTACLLLDLYGTGDSEGDLQQARWQTWIDDLLAGADWLQQRTGLNPTLWGFRFGALLATELAQAQPQRFSRLLLWAPVVDGKRYVDQLLRLRIAASLERHQPAENTTQMRARLEQGESIEISGYLLPGQLSQQIDNKTILPTATQAQRIDWLEAIAEPGQAIAASAQKAIATLRQHGRSVRQHSVPAPAIWHLHHPTQAPALVEKTLQLFV